MPSTALSPAPLLQRLQAIAEETRLHLVQMLAGGERCVCELQDDLGGAAQSRLSFHLRKLKEAGVVSDRKEGRWVYYTLVPGALEELRDLLGELAGGGVVVSGGDVASGGGVASGEDLISGPERTAPARESGASALARGGGGGGGGCCTPKDDRATHPDTGCC